MKDLQSLLNSSSEYKTRLQEARELARKWAGWGLLENLDNEIQRNNMAVILENQAKRLLAEQSSTGAGAGAAGGSFNAGPGEQWAGVALPLVRKVFDQISATDFLSTQPMNLPSGLVFYLDFKYGTDFNGRKAGENMYGNVSTANDKMEVDEEVSGGLYGAGQFGYTINQQKEAVADIALGAANLASVGYNAELDPADFVTIAIDFGASGINDANFDKKGVRAFRLVELNSSTGALVTDFTTNPEFTKRIGDVVEFVVTKAALTAGGFDLSDPQDLDDFAGTVLYHRQPVDNQRGDFEDNPENSITIPEINVELASEPIVAKTRKLKAQWTPEFSQDLQAYQSIDAEAELTSLLSEYISMEVDLELLDMLIQDAVTTERWSAQSNKVWTGSAWASVGVEDGGFYNTQGQWFQTLGTKMQKVSNKIHQKTLRGGANFAVVSPSVATVLESIPGYAANTDGDKKDFAMGVEKVGTLNSRFRVYKNPYMTENIMLMGYRGNQFLETGAVYAPYIPLMMTPLVYNVDTFTPRKGIMTRYSKKMIRPEYYGKIFISDLATI